MQLDGRQLASVTAQSGATLVSLDFGTGRPLQNAFIDIGTQVGRSGTFTVPLPAGSTSTSFSGPDGDARRGAGHGPLRGQHLLWLRANVRRRRLGRAVRRLGQGDSVQRLQQAAGPGRDGSGEGRRDLGDD